MGAVVRLPYHYPATGWFAFGCAVLGGFGLLAGGFAAAGVASMAQRGPSGAMFGIVGGMALIAAVFVGGSAWYWTRIRALDRQRGEYGIVLADGDLASTDWDPFRPRRVSFRLADVESATEGVYRGAPFVRVLTVRDERYSLPMVRLRGADRDRLRQVLGIRRP
jgi:hypothetical protein